MASLPRNLVVPLIVALACVASGACGDLKNAAPNDRAGGDGADGGDASTASITGATGPGPKGSLPTGYCCTADAECRDRRCVAVGSGGRMCLDACSNSSICRRRDLTFTCDAKAPNRGLCQPPDGAFKCLPQNQYRRGARQVGECCANSGDGSAGEECDGNKCVAEDGEGQSNPYVCSHWCDLTKDCPSGTVCSSFHDCVPANRPYTCR